MKAFFACVKKDILLFNSGAGLVTLLLPVLLLLALGVFMGSTAAARGYVAPFPIAVRDEDGSAMSRSLIRQMSEVDLFSEVWLAEEAETDEQLAQRGAACVVTIPKDFFYRVYAMESAPVSIQLNAAMPLEAALTKSMFTSLLEIIRVDQQSARAGYLLQYGELTQEQIQALNADAAEDILRDALGRQSIFDTETAAEDAAQQLRLSFFVSAMSLLVMFLPLVTLKTLPEELDLGVLPRYRAAGGSFTALLGSKLVSALSLSAVPVAGMLIFARPGDGFATAVVLIIAFLAAFSAFLLLSVWMRDAARSQLVGNLLILVQLAVGGALYPLELFSAPIQVLARFTLPYYVLGGMRASVGGLGLKAVITVIWPLMAAIAAAVPALLLLRQRRRI